MIADSSADGVSPAKALLEAIKEAAKSATKSAARGRGWAPKVGRLGGAFLDALKPDFFRLDGSGKALIGLRPSRAGHVRVIRVMSREVSPALSPPAPSRVARPGAGPGGDFSGCVLLGAARDRLYARGQRTSWKSRDSFKIACTMIIFTWWGEIGRPASASTRYQPLPNAQAWKKVQDQ
ncbi:hypothetical protein G3M48_005608, partial [Beauveria asiatica]